jgi:transposase
VGSRRDCTWILGLSGFRVVTLDEAENDRLTIRIERRGVRRYACSCGRRTGRVRSSRERVWDDLPWAAHHVTLVYRQRRIICRLCGIRTERVEFADPKALVAITPPRGPQNGRWGWGDFSNRERLLTRSASVASFSSDISR